MSTRTTTPAARPRAHAPLQAPGPRAGEHDAASSCARHEPPNRPADAARRPLRADAPRHDQGRGSSERGSEDVKKPEEPKKKKKGLLARIRRGVAKRVRTSSTKPRPGNLHRSASPLRKRRAASASSLLLPPILNVRVLGRGGFGVVYLVEKSSPRTKAGTTR